MYKRVSLSLIMGLLLAPAYSFGAMGPRLVGAGSQKMVRSFHPVPLPYSSATAYKTLTRIGAAGVPLAIGVGLGMAIEAANQSKIRKQHDSKYDQGEIPSSSR